MNAIDTMTAIRDALEMDVLTTEPSRFTLGRYADRIEAIGSESPYAAIAVAALRGGDAQTGLGMVQAAARA